MNQKSTAAAAPSAEPTPPSFAGFALLAEGLLAISIFQGLFVHSGAYYPEGRLVTMVFALLAVPFACLARRTRVGSPEFLAILLLAWAFLSASVSPMPRLAFEATSVFAAGILVFLIAPQVEGRILTGLFLVVAMVLAVSVYFETLRAWIALGPLGLFVQPAGYLANANFTGVLLGAAILRSLFPAPSRIPPRLSAVFLALLLPALILTGSRTALLALGIGCLAAFGATRRSFIFLAVLALAGLAIFAHRWDVLANPGHLTNIQRVGMARTAWSGFEASPFFGHGIGTFPILGARHLFFPKWEMHLHDVFLDAAFALGGPGFVFSLAAWGAGLALAFRRRDGVAAVLLASMMTDDLLWIPGFLIFAGLSLRARSGAGFADAPSHPATAMSLAVGTAMLGAFLMIFGGAIPAYSERALKRSRAIGETRPLDAAREIFADRPGLLAARWVFEARAGLIPAVDLNPISGPEAFEDPGLLRQAGLVALVRGDTGEAVRLLMEGLDRDPLNVMAPHHLDLARIYFASGDRVGGGFHWAAAVKKMPRVAAAFRDAFEGDLDLPPIDTASYTPEVLTADHAYRLDEDDAEDVGDVLHFRHHRRRAAGALAADDIPEATREIRAAWFLAQREVGKDPRTLRLLIDIGRRRGDKTDHFAQMLYQARPPRGPYGAAASRAYARSMPADGELAGWLGGPR